MGFLYKELISIVLLFYCSNSREQLHVICDEIYSLSVFEGEFHSSVTQQEQLPDSSRTHFLWGFSKVQAHVLLLVVVVVVVVVVGVVVVVVVVGVVVVDGDDT